MTRFQVYLFLFFGLFSANIAGAQALDDYRSLTSGNWNSTATWQRHDGTDWQNNPATVPSRNDGAITIRSTHTVTVNTNRDVDQFTIDVGATVLTSSRLRVYDGVGTDMQVDGTLRTAGSNVILQTGTTNTFSATSLVEIPLNTIRTRGNSVTTFQTGAALTTSGSGGFSIEQTSVVTFESGTTITNENNFRVRNGAIVNVSGDFIHSGEFQQQNTSQLNFSTGSVLEYARDGGSFPTPDLTTFSGGSTVLVTGVTSTVPGNLDQAFHDFEWNATGQTADIVLGAAPLSFGGDFTVSSTGATPNVLVWVNGASSDMTISGNYVQNSGIFEFTRASGNGTLFATNASITGGTLDLNSGPGNPVIELTGDLTVSGTVTETGSGDALVLFAGTLQQSINAPTGITENVNIEVDNPAGAILTSNLSAPADLTLTDGVFDLAGFDISIGGDLDIQSSTTNAGVVLFNGVVNQSVTAPAELVLGAVILDNPGNTISFLADIRITDYCTLRASSTIDTNGNLFTFSHGATFLNNGTVTGDVTIERLYNQTTDGWRMLASPLSGISYSDLNGTFETQGATWASTTLGSSNLERMDFGAQDWTPQTGADASFTLGEGYIFYMFTDDKLGNPVLPATWSVTGTTGSVSSSSLSWTGDPATSFNYMGNPTTTNLDWDAVALASNQISSTYSTWDPFLTTAGGLTGYKYYNSSGQVGSAGRYISPFTAFMAQATGAASSLAFATNEGANSANGNYFGKSGRYSSGESAPSPYIRLQVEGNGMAEVESYLVFDERASDLADSFDVTRIKPFSEEYVALNLLSPTSRLAFDGRPMAAGQQKYHVELLASRAGLYEVTWPEWNDIPFDWTILLYDKRTGRKINMRTTRSASFLIGPKEARVTFDPYTTEDAHGRFEIIISDESITSKTDESVPETDLILAPNFPNPFSESTTIRVSIPEPGLVSLIIYDLLGKRIAVVADGSYQEGWHTFKWNPANATAGTYFARLSQGHQTLSTSLILAR